MGSKNVKTCAHFPFTNHIGFQNDIVSEEDIISGLDLLENWRRETINKLRKGDKTSCDGCSGLHWGVWTKEPRVRTFAVGPSFADVTRCNANCFYCNQNSSIHNPKNNNQILSNYDVHKIASNYYDSIEEIILADGEPTICPSFKQTMDLAGEKGWAMQLNTNAIVYDEEVAEMLANNSRSFVAISLDSGTSETYKRIKRVDRFNRVVSNLMAYGMQKCTINMKYILMKGYNDSIEEIQSFIDICKKIGCKHVTLSQNISGFYDGVKSSSNVNMPEELFCLFTYFIARLQEENIHWDFQIEFISKHDYDRLEQLRR